MLFDTHCHLNFSAFVGQVDETIKRSLEVGVNYIMVPGTDVETSKKAVEIASSVTLSSTKGAYECFMLRRAQHDTPLKRKM